MRAKNKKDIGNTVSAVKEWLTLIIVVLAFTALAVIFTVYDFSITARISSLALENGEYYSHSVFVMLSEIFAALPLYVMVSFCGFSLYAYSINKLKGIKRVALCFFGYLIISTCVFIFLNKAFEYLLLSLNLYKLAKMEYVFDIFIIILAETAPFFVMRTVKTVSDDGLKKRLTLTAIILFALIGFALVPLLKTVVGRVRYSTMNALDNFSLYTRWYKVNGSRVLINISDSCKSFPSGHTYSAAATIALVYAARLFAPQNKRIERTVLIVTSLYAALIAFSRLLGGMHFASDTLFSVFLSLVFVTAGGEIFYYKFSRLKRLLAPNRLGAKASDSTIKN